MTVAPDERRLWPADIFCSTVLLFFFASGAAGLIYEVIWSRYLTTIFGATLPAVSTVLAAFMGGLALGSFALGKRSDTMQRPLRFYAFLELGIAIGGVGVPILLMGLEPLNRLVFGLISNFAAITFYRFLVNFIVLLLPTTLMGATLPVLSRFLVHRRDTLGLNVGSLYAANTFGAVTGAAVCGFALIAMLGVRGAMFTAAALNMLVFVLAYTLSGKLEQGDAPQEQIAEPEENAPLDARLSRIALITYGISGFVALSLQVVWTRGLAFCTVVLRSSTYSFSAMLTVFLAGLAIGSAIITPRVDRQEQPSRLYALLLLLLGLASGLSGILLFNIAPAVAPFNDLFVREGDYVPFWVATLDLFFNAVLVMGLPTLLMGMLFPVAAKLCVPNLRRVGGSVGRLYAMNTIGSIFGAFAAGFILIPLLGMSRTILLLTGVEMVLGVSVLLADRKITPMFRMAMATAGVAALVIFALRLPTRNETFRNALPLHSRVLAYEEGPLATVSVTEDPLGYREIAVDNVGVAGTSRVMLTDQKSLAHLPALLLHKPSKVLTVGFGSGGASYSYTLYPELKNVHCVEIASTVLRPEIQRLLTASNGGLLDRLKELPQYHIIQADARSYLRFTRERYDSIATDCTDLRYKSNANLYDREYFQLCRDRLTDDGMVVVWMPLGALTREIFTCALGTFHDVFPEMHVWYFNTDTVHYILLAGFKQKHLVDYNELAQRLARGPIAKDLKILNLNDPDKILGCYVTGGEPLAKLLKNSRINTENNPIIEFEAPLSAYNDELLWGNLQWLYSNRQSVLQIIKPDSISPEHAQRIESLETAAPVIAEGLQAQVQFDYETAAQRYKEASHLAPDDPVLTYLQSFRDTKLTYEHSTNKATPALLLGQASYGNDQYPEALKYFEEALSQPNVSRDTQFQAMMYMGKTFLKLGRKIEAQSIQDALAKQGSPGERNNRKFRQFTREVTEAK